MLFQTLNRTQEAVNQNPNILVKTKVIDSQILNDSSYASAMSFIGNPTILSGQGKFGGNAIHLNTGNAGNGYTQAGLSFNDAVFHNLGGGNNDYCIEFHAKFLASDQTEGFGLPSKKHFWSSLGGHNSASLYTWGGNSSWLAKPSPTSTQQFLLNMMIDFAGGIGGIYFDTYYHFVYLRKNNMCQMVINGLVINSYGGNPTNLGPPSDQTYSAHTSDNFLVGGINYGGNWNSAGFPGSMVLDNLRVTINNAVPYELSNITPPTAPF